MKKQSGTSLAILFLALFGVFSLLLSTRPISARAASFVVNSTTDSPDISVGDGICSTGSGNCTLRAALEEANATTGTNPISITFAIPGAGVQTISLTQGLPSINRSNITIDGSTQPGSSCGNLWGGVEPVWNIKIADDGSTDYHGLNVLANSTTIKGLWITGFDNGMDNSSAAVYIGNGNNNAIICNNLDTNGTGVKVAMGTGNVIGGSAGGGNLIKNSRQNEITLNGGRSTLIQENFMGVDAHGTIPQAAGGSIRTAGADGTVIRHNLMSKGGVLLTDNEPADTTPTTNATIVGNYIGTDITGTVDLSAPGEGVRTKHAANITIGSSNLADRNIIVSNVGVDVADYSSNVTVRGNYINVSPDGNEIVGSCLSGLNDFGGAATIGGDKPGEGNVISGCTFGISLGSTTVVKGNYVGTDATGLVPLGNTIGVAFGGSGGTVGGVTSSAKNIISGNTIGVAMMSLFGPSTGNTLSGNYIGVGADGITPIGNDYGVVLVGASTANNMIGGNASSSGNIIANSRFAAITTYDFVSEIVSNAYGFNPAFGSAGTSNAFLGNSIYNGAELSIDLASTVQGPTLNDPLDVDTGPNNFQNYPVITKASGYKKRTIVHGTLQSASKGTFRIEFFWTPEGKIPQGKLFLGSLQGKTSVKGKDTFTAARLAPIPGPGTITATATDSANNTSEFSLGIPVKIMFTALDTEPLNDSVAAE